MSLIYGWDDSDNDEACTNGNTGSTIKTSITFTKYNNRRIVKVFDKGIILGSIVTISGRVSPAHAGQVYYNFCSVDGKTKVRKISSYSGNYFEILNKDMDDKVINLRDVYTVPNACSITVELATYSRSGKPTEQDRNSKATLAPPSPVKLNITLFYTEFPAFNYNASDASGSVFAF